MKGRRSQSPQAVLSSEMKNSSSEERVKTLGQILEGVIAGLPGGGATVALGTVLKLLEEDGAPLICLFLALPFVVPVSIPGTGMVLGLFIFLLGSSVLFNIPPPLPRRMLERSYPAAKLRTVLQRGLVWVHRIERLSRPRLLAVSRGPGVERFNGFILSTGGLLLMAPFPGVVFFTNTLPGLAVIFLAIGMLQHDGFWVLAGYFMTLVTIIYFSILLVAGAVGLDRLWHVVERWLVL